MSFILKHDVSETGFCLHLQVEPIRVGPVVRASLNGVWGYWAHLSRSHLKTETEFSLRNVVFLNTRQGDGYCPEFL
jgi:hypothetical protein